jgi:hypothetical protein
MGSLAVERCWFEGFDKAIDLAADYRSHVEIRGTMIVPSTKRDAVAGQGSELYGWGVRIEFRGVDAPNAKVALANILFDHCTVEGAGLIDLTTSAGPGHMRVEARHCAVRGETLLALHPNRPPESQIRWQGEANQYDVHGRSWLVSSASAGSPIFSIAATDLKGWVEFAPGDKNPILSKLKYQKDPAARPESLRPQDFVIDAPWPPQAHPGANPELVGPWSHP